MGSIVFVHIGSAGATVTGRVDLTDASTFGQWIETDAADAGVDTTGALAAELSADALAELGKVAE